MVPDADLTAKFTEVWPEYEGSIARAEGLLARGEGDPQACCRSLLTTNRWLAGMSLALGKPDSIAIEYLGRAVAAALRMMTERGSTAGPRVVDVELAERSDGSVDVLSYRPRPSRPHSPKPSLVAYMDALVVVIAFGTPSEIDTMASYGPSDYQSEALIVGRDVLHANAALRAWLAGRDEEARRLIRNALSYGRNPGDSALLALMEADGTAFNLHLERRLADHERQYKEQPYSPERGVCVHALALARLAAAAGLSTPDHACLPVRLQAALPHRTVTPPPVSPWAALLKRFRA